MFADGGPQENTENAVHATKSVETTRAHLQGQLHSKEADNNRLTVQLRVTHKFRHQSISQSINHYIV
uniref:Uncharacterized protein n=1 Tax=Oncorhynchus kisutch TaxID=8019 RepID=A0A8C7H3M6_ONCKI